MRKTLRVSVLMAVMASTAHAGLMPNGVAPPPPPPPPSAANTDGLMPNGNPQSISTDDLIPNGQAVLVSLIQSLLALS